MTCIGASFGTPMYLAPELVEMEIRKIAKNNINYNLCDVYSLGLTIMRMLTSEMVG